MSDAARDRDREIRMDALKTRIEGLLFSDLLVIYGEDEVTVDMICTGWQRDYAALCDAARNDALAAFHNGDVEPPIRRTPGPVKTLYDRVAADAFATYQRLADEGCTIPAPAVRFTQPSRADAAPPAGKIHRGKWRFNLLPRRPDFVIGGPDRPYLRRWRLISTPWFNVYLHNVCRDDDDRALHDHPWDSCSIILAGGYYEVLPEGDVADNAAHLRHKLCWRGPGAVDTRRAAQAHRLVLEKDAFTAKPKPAWTLFLTSRRVREWGFHCPRGWVPWRIFTDPDSRGETGAGCGE